MGLQLDMAVAEQGMLAIPIVLHDRVIHNEFAVEPDRGSGTGLQNTKLIPLAKRFVG